MRAIKTIAAATGFALAALAATAASADDHRGRGDDRGGWDRGGWDDDRPGRCDDDHDHRVHHPRYYDFYPADRYSRAGPYGGPRDRWDDRYYGPARRGSRVIRRDVFDTRYRARIFLIEEEFFGPRGGYRRVCTLDVRGPDARFVPRGQIRSIANRACSRRSEIRII